MTDDMTDDELLALCEALRKQPAQAGVEHVEAAEQLTAELRERFVALRRPRVPPDDVRVRLRRTGWLVYELTWALLRRIDAGYEKKKRDEPAWARSKAADDLLVRATTAGRSLPWPAYAARVLGAIRAEALAASKRDTEQDYQEAAVLHREARNKYHDYWHAVGPNRTEERRALDETMIQLELAETGTACRTAERLMCRWGFDQDGIDSERGEEFWYLRLFQDLGAGAEVGRSALDRVAAVDKQYGLADRVDEHRLALLTGYRNPGVMTARAHLLRVPMTTLLERDDKRPPRGATSWDDARDRMIAGALGAHEEIEHAVDRTPMRTDDKRSLVQLRLNLAWLQPGTDVACSAPFAPCVERPTLDAQAIEDMSAWLAEIGDDGKKRGDANVISSAVMPSYLAALRATFGAERWVDYVEWRRRWFVLDRHEDEDDRRDYVERALADVT